MQHLPLRDPMMSVPQNGQNCTQTSTNVFDQMSQHIQTKSSSCIDLIFTDQTDLIVNSGVHASLHSNCNHEVVHSSFNLKGTLMKII